MRQLLLRFGATGKKKLVWIEIHFPGPQVVITNIPHPRISSGGWRQQTVRNQDENCFVPAESKVKSVDGIFSLVSWCRPSGTWKCDSLDFIYPGCKIFSLPPFSSFSWVNLSRPSHSSKSCCERDVFCSCDDSVYSSDLVWLKAALNYTPSHTTINLKL